MDLGKVLFPKYHPSRRRKEMKALGFGLLLGIVCCGVIGAIIYTLAQQGRL